MILIFTAVQAVRDRDDVARWMKVIRMLSIGRKDGDLHPIPDAVHLRYRDVLCICPVESFSEAKVMKREWRWQG